MGGYGRCDKADYVSRGQIGICGRDCWLLPKWAWEDYTNIIPCLGKSQNQGKDKLTNFRLAQTFRSLVPMAKRVCTKHIKQTAHTGYHKLGQRL